MPIALKLKMVCECWDNRENTDLLEFKDLFAIFESLFCIIEERVMVVVNIVNANLENTLAVVLRVRFDELHSDIQMVERFHSEIVFLAVIFNITSIIDIVWVHRKRQVKIFLKRFVRVDGCGQRNSITSSKNP